MRPVRLESSEGVEVGGWGELLLAVLVGEPVRCEGGDRHNNIKHSIVPQTTKLPRSISVCKAICKNETCTRHFSRLAIRKETTGLAWPNPRLSW